MLGVEPLRGRFFAMETVVGKACPDEAADGLLRRQVGIRHGRAVGLRPGRPLTLVMLTDQPCGFGCGGQRRVEPPRIRHPGTLRGSDARVNCGLTDPPPLPRMTRDDRCPGCEPGLIGKPVRETIAIPALPPQR
jgi:hypothetical protein